MRGLDFTGLSKELEYYIGTEWKAELYRMDSYEQSIGINLHYSTVSSPMTKDVVVDLCNSFSKLKFFRDSEEKLKSVTKQLEEANKQLAIYKEVLPNLVASLSENGGYSL